MTVMELIRILEGYDLDAEVKIHNRYGDTDGISRACIAYDCGDVRGYFRG
jgi:hypothetical protein